jgi:HlyD family secretion protein
MKSKLIKTIIACVIVVAVAVGGYFGYNKFLAAKPVKATTQYLTVSAKKMNMQVTIQGTGAAYAAVTKDVAPNNNGTIKDLNVKVGDTVTAGAKLFTADSDDLRKNVTSAQNNLNKQNLTLASDQASLASAQAAVTAAATAAQTVDNSKGPASAGGQSSQNPQDAVTSAQNKISMDKLNIADAQNQLTYANQQLSKAAVTAPIGGVITAVNNLNGDSVQPGKAVLSIVDMSSLKIKVQVDELDIEKTKIGQKAQIIFDAIKGKTYDGTVETIAQTGTTANNVTTYDVIVDITDPTGIKIGMNANVTIQVDSKDNALTIPSEALIDRNGQKFVLVPNTSSTASSAGTQGTSNNNQNTQNSSGNNGQSTNGNNQGQQSSNNQNGNGQGKRNGQSGTNSGSYNVTSSGRLVKVETGLENQNYVEITQGLNEGEKVLVQLPQTSSTTNNNNRNALSGGFGGGFGGGGNFSGGNRQQSGGNSSAKGD